MAATRKRTSAVWDFFELNEEVLNGEKTKKAICKLCDGLKLAYGGGTTNLMSHLRAKHAEEFRKITTKESQAGQKKQTTLGAFQTKRCCADRANKITTLVAEFVSKDLRPISTIDGKGFQQLLNFMEPGYKIPSRPHMTKTCRDIYDCLKEKLIENLADKSVAVTTDLWTSRATESYITITAHFLDEEWNIQNYVLVTRAMPERNIDEKNISAIVRDNASNMVVAVAELGWPDVPCFAHTLQLAVNNGLDLTQLSKIKAVARKLVGHFKHSSLGMTALKAKQQQMSIPQHHLIQDVATRWNSTYFMMERLLEQRWCIYAVFHDDNSTQSQYKNLLLNESQWALLEQLTKVLKPLQVATTALCESEIVSVSLVYPVINGLLTKHLCTNEGDLAPVKSFKEKVSAEIKCRFTPGSLEIEDHAPLLAAALDPHFHQLKCLGDAQRSIIHDSLKKRSELINLQEDDNNPADNPDIEPPPKKKIKETAITFLLGEQDELCVEDEMGQFMREPTLSSEKNSLQWWKKNADRFPTLAQIARKLLCIPATSVPAERVFSTAGLVINHQRSSLLPENADMLIFLNKNLPRL